MGLVHEKNLSLRIEMIDPRIKKIQAFWNAMGIESLNNLGEIYASNVRFEDPLSKGTGLEELKKHFERIYQNFPSVTYEFGRSIASLNSLVIEWTMRATFRKSKRSFVLPGVSFLGIDTDTGLISESKEYYNLGQGIYQHVPFLGAIVKIVKSKAASI
jgi:hypothetical protein